MFLLLQLPRDGIEALHSAGSQGNEGGRRDGDVLWGLLVSAAEVLRAPGAKHHSTSLQIIPRVTISSL